MKRIGTLGCLGLVLGLAFQPSASATHFRGAIFAWKADAVSGPFGVTFKVPFTVRRDGYTGTAPDGHPAVGDVVLENIGGTTITFGDGFSTDTLYMRVIAIDSINNTLTGYLEEYLSTSPYEIRHGYPDAGPFTAYIETCCRISTDPLNADNTYRLETIVRPASTNRCPQTNFVSNVDVQAGSTLSFTLLTSDPDGDPRTFRFSDSSESLLTLVPGVTVDGSTGLIQWSVPPMQTLGPYGNQIMVEDGECKVPVDFTITVRAAGANSPPKFDQPPSPCNQTIEANAGTPMGFTVRGSDPNAGNIVTLNNSGLPTGATFSAPPGNPSTGAFAWNPGVPYINTTQIIVFTATDGSLYATPCSTAVHVQPPVNFPKITNIQPNNGPSLGGTSVTITGSNYQAGLVVAFGEYPCAVTNQTATSITCTTHAHAAGAVDVTVTNPDGGYVTSPNGFTYTCASTAPTAAVSGMATTCPGDGVDLTVNMTGTPPWTLYWSDGIVEPAIGTTPHVRTVNPAETTVYMVHLVTDASCGGAGSGSGSVTVNAVSSTITSPDALCPSASAEASVKDAGVGATYAWSVTNGMITSGQGTKKITYSVGALGTLHVEVTVTANGCQSTSSRDLPVEPPPTATLSGDTTICSGNLTPLQVDLTGTPPWSLSFSDGFIASDVDDTPYLRPVSPGSTTAYTLTAVADKKACGGTFGGSATVNVIPSASAAITTSANVCHDSTGNAASVPDAGPGATYQWALQNGTITGGQGTRSITFSAAAGTVNVGVTVTAQNGCVSVQNVDVFVWTPLSATETDSNSTVCSGGSVTLHAALMGTPPYHVTWSDAFQQTVSTATATRGVNPTSTTTYSIASVTDASGCTGITSGSVTITVPPVAPAITTPTAVCPGSTGNTASVADAGPGTTYSWFVSGGTLTGGQGTASITYTAGAGPTLTVGLTMNVPPGCSGQSSKQVGVSSPSAAVIGSSTLFAAPSANIQVSLTGTPPWSLTWADNVVQSNILTSPATRTVTPLRTTTYTLTGVANGTCSVAATGSAQVIPQGVGDVNASGKVDVQDVFYLINYLFANGAAPLRSGDVNQSNSVTIQDVFYLINYLFAGGPPPP